MAMRHSHCLDRWRKQLEMAYRPAWLLIRGQRAPTERAFGKRW